MTNMEKNPKITPRGKQILVRPDDKPSRESKSGLLTPDNVEKESKAFGIVVAVGPEIEDVEVGRRVIYGAFAGEKISLSESSEEVDYVLLFDEDVLAFIDGDVEDDHCAVCGEQGELESDGHCSQCS